MGSIAAVPDYRPRNINTRVPSMTFAADVVNGVAIANLGAPKTLDADGIWDGVAAEATASTGNSSTFKAATFDGSSTSLVANSLGEIDAPFGRTIDMLASSGADHVVTLFGRDYLGAPLREQYTLSGTTVIVGKKAFKWIDSYSIAAGGAAGDTMDVGWTDTLGLPYKTLGVLYSLEAGDRMNTHMETVRIVAEGVDIAATGALSVTAPFDGYIVKMGGIMTTANTTAISTLDAISEGTGIPNLDVIAPIAAAGFEFSTVADEDEWVAVSKGGVVTLTSDGGGTAGVADLYVEFSRGLPELIPGDATTATATTGDVRGTYNTALACNGTRTFVVACHVDETNLHGVVQFNG